MDVEESYKHWSSQYDTNINKTRDLEAVSLRQSLSDIQFENCLEIGCGTGKNTEWLITKGKRILAVDISDDMLNIAKQKITDDNVRFVKADITGDWHFTDETFDLVVCSLVLEHIEDIASVIQEIADHLRPGGTLYIGELHPFKQYTGSKARFETEQGEQVVPCFNHHVSDFTMAAVKVGLKIESLDEFFDKDKVFIPRILTLRFSKER